MEDIYINMNCFVAGTEIGFVSYVFFDAGCGSIVVDRDSGSLIIWMFVFYEWIDVCIFFCVLLIFVLFVSVNLYNILNL